MLVMEFCLIMSRRKEVKPLLLEKLQQTLKNEYAKL